MKYTAILLALVSLHASVITASPSPSPEALANPSWGYGRCKWAGQGCSEKLKRAVDNAHAHLSAADDAVDDDAHADYIDAYCSDPAEPCNVAKRSAEALASALAEAHAFANPEARFRWGYGRCKWTGQGCSEKRSAEPEAFWGYGRCKWAGQGCSEKMKRAANEVLTELGEGEPEFVDTTPEQTRKLKDVVDNLQNAAADFQPLE